MTAEITNIIERVFAQFEQADEGDFIGQVRSQPYDVIPPRGDGAQVLFTTKPYSVAASLERTGEHAEIGMIGRYGLPAKEDVPWIRDVVGRRELWFLGDMDPADLMIFAWLRASLAPKTIHYLGISDAYLESLSITPPPSFTISLSSSEQESLATLAHVLPDLEDLIGDRLNRLLQNSRKLELEAVINSNKNLLPWNAS